MGHEKAIVVITISAKTIHFFDFIKKQLSIMKLYNIFILKVKKTKQLSYLVT